MSINYLLFHLYGSICTAYEIEYKLQVKESRIKLNGMIYVNFILLSLSKHYTQFTIAVQIESLIESQHGLLSIWICIPIVHPHSQSSFRFGTSR